MSGSEPAPLIQMNLAPELPHFGKHFVHHGPCGVVTFRIDVQDYTHDGHVLVSGMAIHGTEVYPTGIVADCTGKQLSIFVTESEYMRLSDSPLE